MDITDDLGLVPDDKGPVEVPEAVTYMSDVQMAAEFDLIRERFGWAPLKTKG